MLIKIINHSTNQLPSISTLGASGMDLRAFLDEPIVLKSMERCLVPTGLYIEIPKGYEGQVRSRSGLAINNGVMVLNAPGTIDSDYRGEIKIILMNLSKDDFEIKNGDRIAQLVISSYVVPEWKLVDTLDDTQRNTGGFGSTGL